MFALLAAMLFVGAGPEADGTLRPLLEERVATGRNPGIVVGVQDGDARRLVAAVQATCCAPSWRRVTASASFSSASTVVSQPMQPSVMDWP